MELKFDVERFNQRAAILVNEIALRVKLHLLQAGMQGEALEDSVSKITMSMASLLDDLAAVEAGGVEVRPYLTFRTDDELLLHCGENSNTHEFVYDALKKAFG
jgi:hypothetical protein